MEVSRSCCNLPSLLVLCILILFPVNCSSIGDIYKPQKKRTESTLMKRFYTADYGTFVGLMGKRHAAPAINYGNHILADLLQQKTGVGCPSTQALKNWIKFRLWKAEEPTFSDKTVKHPCLTQLYLMKNPSVRNQRGRMTLFNFLY